MGKPPGPVILPIEPPVNPAVVRLESVAEMLLGRVKPKHATRLQLSYQEISAVISIFKAKAALIGGGGGGGGIRPDPRPR